jgi:predicted permease
LFTLGLVLSGQRLSIGVAAMVNIVFKILAQPLVMLLLAMLLGVTGVYRREMILLGALPTASMTAMFAVQYKVYVAESDATILLSTVISIASLGVCIVLTSGLK